MKLYGNYRMAGFNKGNGEYSISYLASQQFSDYEGLIDIRDLEIPNDRYTKINANGKKNLTKFVTYEGVAGVDEVELRKSINLISSYNAIELFNTVEEARTDIRNRTDLEEVEPGKFLIKKEHTDELTGEVVPVKYLIIN